LAGQKMKMESEGKNHSDKGDRGWLVTTEKSSLVILINDGDAKVFRSHYTMMNRKNHRSLALSRPYSYI
jgi:RNase P/RNase MRP subunit p29